MTVVQYEAPPPLPPSRPGQELEPGPTGDVARLRAAAEYAGFIADTEFVPDAMRGRPAAIAAAMLAGAEVGLRPMASLRMVSMIQGKPTLTAEAQRGLVAGAGHELWFEESTTTRAIAAGRRAGTDRIGRVTWTLDDAKRARIDGKPNWRLYPAEMLRARASAALVRAMFADVTLGIPATEELDDEAAVNGPPAGDVPPPPADAAAPTAATRTRRRPRATTPAPQPERPALPPTPPPDAQPEPETQPEPLATDAYKRRIFATMRDLDLGDRDERLAYTSRVIGREVASSNELTIGEAQRLIEQLEADKNARAAGEKALLDELRATLDAKEISGGIGEPQWNRLQELFAEKAVGGIDEQLAYARGVLPRWKGETLTGLTADEASAVIAHLEQYDRDDPQTWPFPDGF